MVGGSWRHMACRYFFLKAEVLTAILGRCWGHEAIYGENWSLAAWVKSGLRKWLSILWTWIKNLHLAWAHGPLLSKLVAQGWGWNRFDVRNWNHEVEHTVRGQMRERWGMWKPNLPRELEATNSIVCKWRQSQLPHRVACTEDNPPEDDLWMKTQNMEGNPMAQKWADLMKIPPRN